MSEAGDYTPGWVGHDFDSARKDYRQHARTSLNVAVQKGVIVKDLVPESLYTESSNPTVVIYDQTGSMDEWPGVMFAKAVFFDHECRTEYRGEDVEYSWSAIGDAHNRERYPFQARNFTKGQSIESSLKEIVSERDGGGQTYETYEYAALYYARNVEMPNAINPLLIFIGDESPYETIEPDLAKHLTHIELKKTMRTSDAFKELKQKFTVYLIQKPYGSGTLTDGELTGTTKRVHDDWAKLVGEDHIVLLGDPNRVMDTILGIMAHEAGKTGEFTKELTDRQTPAQVKTVMTSLKTIHALPKGGVSQRRLLGAGKSVTRRSKKNKKEDDE